MTEGQRDPAYRDRAVLVTGGAGAIGGNLVRALAVAGASPVTVIDDLSSGFRWHLRDVPQVRLVEGSITDQEALARAFDPAPEVVFHLAAHFANQNSVDHPERDLEVNGLGTLRVLQRSLEAEVTRVVSAASGCALANGGGAVAGAAEPGTLTTPYQITKLLGEHYAAFFCGHHGLPVARARLFNVYGPGEVPGRYRNVITNFIHRALTGQPLVITGSGDETRDFCWVGDAVDALLAGGLRDAAIGRAFDVASGREVAIGDLAELVLEVTGTQVPIQHAPRRDWDHKPHLRGDPTPARQLLGLGPGAVSLEDGLRRTVAWFRDNWDRIQRDADFG